MITTTFGEQDAFEEGSSNTSLEPNILKGATNGLGEKRKRSESPKGGMTEGSKLDINSLTPPEVLALTTQFASMKVASAASEALLGLDETIQDRGTLRENFGNIITSVLFTQKPIDEVMKDNEVTHLKGLMSALRIQEDVGMFGAVMDGRYEQTDRKEIAQELAKYAKKPIVTAADIAAGIAVTDGDVVMLGYDDMVIHKGSLRWERYSLVCGCIHG